MKHLSCAIALLLALGSTHAAESTSSVSRSENVSVATITIIDKQADAPFHPRNLRMPYVTTPNTSVSANINDRLFIGQLNGLSPIKPAGTLNSTLLQLDGIASQDFELTRLDARVLTLRFDIDGCGAYCEEYSTSYSFDLRNGRMLHSADLFTKAGMRNVATAMHKEKRRLYKGQITELQQALRAEQMKPSPDRENLDDLQERLELNQECLARTQEYARRDNASFHYSWSFLPQHALLHAGRCSNHASRALDDVGDIDLPLSYATLRQGMAAYGRTVLLGEGDARSSQIFGQVLRGKIGAQPIVMLLQRQNDDSISGSYFYTRHRKAIDLYGRINGNDITLSEHDADSNVTAQLTLRVDDKQLRGEWQQDKALPVTLHAP